jgi:glutaredoxin
MIKKALVSVFIFIGLMASIGSAAAETNIVNAYLFYGEGCPHCAQEKEFLDLLNKDYPNLQIHEYEIYKNKANAILLEEASKSLNIKVSGVPFLVIGEENFTGYAPGITSEKIENKVAECSINECPDLISPILEKRSAETGVENSRENEEDNGTVLNLPVFGKVDLKKFSLPLLTVVMGSLDGFNPCAMWVLIFLISMLLGTNDRKKMWILGIAFIVTSAIVYFIFMAAWLNLIIFLGFIIWIRLLIGLLALIGGGYNIKEFLFNKQNVCKVTDGEKKKKISSKIKDIIDQNKFWVALGGIIVLAFMINLVELVCSAGFPAIYTQILALSNLPTWQYYSYILLYIFFFMLDDLFVFFIAMITLKMTGVTTKYAKYSHLIGGILMLLIGISLILKPELLMF